MEIEVPLVAVLPFADLSSDVSGNGVADRVANEVITILSSFPSIRVVVDTNQPAGAEADPGSMGRKLGASYVLTGSVIREPARLCVMAQLVDAASGEQVWGKRYEEDPGDARLCKSYIAESIGYALAGTEGIVINREGHRAWRKSTAELTEYDYFTRTQVMRYRGGRDHYGPLREIWAEGLARFPDPALLRIFMAFSYMHGLEVPSSLDPTGDLRRAWKLATEADPAAGRSPFTAMLHSWLMAGLCQWHEGDFDQSVALARQTIRMAPYHVRARAHLSLVLANAGRIDQAIEWAEWAMRHNPRHGFVCNLAWAYYLAGRYEDAIAALDEVGTEYVPQLAAVHVRLGRVAEARAAIASWLRSFPHVSIDLLALEPIREPWKQGWLHDLRVAGVPESFKRV